MVQPAHEQPARLLVGAPLLALHLRDLFWTSLRFYRIDGGDYEEEESAHRRRRGAGLAQLGQPLPLVSLPPVMSQSGRRSDAGN